LSKKRVKEIDKLIASSYEEPGKGENETDSIITCGKEGVSQTRRGANHTLSTSVSGYHSVLSAALS
jgi:hypothetical protein